MTNRRDFVKLTALAPFAMSIAPSVFANQTQELIAKKIPSSGELLPVIGMGSSQTFNVSDDLERKNTLLNVLKTFFKMGGSLIDSSPMYGKSESVIGELMSKIEPAPEVFAASKVWTDGKQPGVEAIAESQRRMQVDKMDLMQVHNLRDWQIHMDTLDEYKTQGKIRYTGITTSRISQYDDFEAVMKSRKMDFVQLNYNIKVRDAEKKLLPLAKDKGIAVLVNRPYEKGRLFKLVRSTPLPEWASEFDCATWGQFFLKFIVSHPAVTCAIPATSKVHHMSDNMQAQYGRLPDQKTRQKMIQLIESL